MQKETNKKKKHQQVFGQKRSLFQLMNIMNSCNKLLDNSLALSRLVDELLRFHKGVPYCIFKLFCAIRNKKSSYF